MKKTSLLVALPAVALSGLLLSGCGMFRSHKAWETAQQESPLEIPPSLDRPSTSEALVIPPPGANQPTANGATAAGRRGAGGQIADGFVLADTVDDAYRRVGQVLESGSLGQLVGHDDAAHTYTLTFLAPLRAAEKKGFFGRMFGHGKSDSARCAGCRLASGAGQHRRQRHRAAAKCARRAMPAAVAKVDRYAEVASGRLIRSPRIRRKRKRRPRAAFSFVLAGWSSRLQRSQQRSLSGLPSQSLASAGASLRSVITGQSLASSAFSATKVSWPAGTSSSG